MADYLCKDAHTGVTASVTDVLACLWNYLSNFTWTQLVLNFTHALFCTPISRLFIFVFCFLVISEHGKIPPIWCGYVSAEEVWLCAHWEGVAVCLHQTGEAVCPLIRCGCVPIE